MNVIVKIIVTLVISMVMTEINTQENYSIKGIAKNAKSNAGGIFLGLYNTAADFLDKKFKDLKSEIGNKLCSVTFENIPAGVYAVSIFHDENDNGKMDSNFKGIPKEDYKSSNEAFDFMGPPK